MNLSEAFPEFLPELRSLLERAGLPAIAARVYGLELASRCGCGDEFCSTFYVTDSRSPLSPEEREQGGLEPVTRDLESEQGIVVVGMDALGRLTKVEVLHRPEVEGQLQAAIERLRVRRRF